MEKEGCPVKKATKVKCETANIIKLNVFLNLLSFFNCSQVTLGRLGLKVFKATRVIETLIS